MITLKFISFHFIPEYEAFGILLCFIPGFVCIGLYLSGGEETDIEDNEELAAASGVIRDRDPNPELPQTVEVLETSWGSKVYVVGTAHFSEESQEDVVKVKNI